MPAMASPRREPESLNIQLLVDSIPALIHTARPDGYLDYFNKPWLEYLGATLEQVSGWNWRAFIHPEDVEGIVARWLACLASGEIFEYETRVRRADGEYRWMFHCKVPLRDGRGNIVKWYGSSLDIAERKTAEEQLCRNAKELQRSEFYLVEGQRLGHMGSWAFDPDGFYYWSPELFRMHGLDPASKPPSLQEYLACVHTQDRESMADLIKGILAEASPFDATKRIVRPDGEVRYIRCVGVPFVDSQSLKKYVGSAIDVTEHELLTQELRRREAYLAEAQRLSHTGSFGWNVSTDEHFWSDETFRIFEFDPSSKVSLQMILECVHPQDMPSVKMAIAAATRADGIDLESRLLMPDGRIKYLHVVGKAERGETGSIEVIGAVMDVTARKLTEVELRRSKAHLTDAQRLSHVGSVGMEASTKRIFWSEESARIYGYAPGTEPTPDLILQRVHPEDVGLVKDALERAGQGGADFDFEHRLLMPDGSIKHIRNLAHSVRDEAATKKLSAQSWISRNVKLRKKRSGGAKHIWPKRKGSVTRAASGGDRIPEIWSGRTKPIASSSTIAPRSRPWIWSSSASIPRTSRLHNRSLSAHPRLARTSNMSIVCFCRAEQSSTSAPLPRHLRMHRAISNL